MAISNRVGACPFTPLPFEDNSSTSDRPEKQTPVKADQGTINNDAHMDCYKLVH